jgi:hypothetical protein
VRIFVLISSLPPLRETWALVYVCEGACRVSNERDSTALTVADALLVERSALHFGISSADGCTLMVATIRVVS